MEIAGNVLITVGLVFILFGIIGLFRLNDFYQRVLITSKIDTIGVITIIVGMILKHGLSFFSLKLLLLILLIVILNTLVAHVVARSAYSSAGGLHDDDDVHGGK